MERSEDLGRRKGGGAELGARTYWKRCFKAVTGHKGEWGRRGICMTWEEDCIALAHFKIMWAPGGPKITSPLRK